MLRFGLTASNTDLIHFNPRKAELPQAGSALFEDSAVLGGVGKTEKREP